jgi:hypothetical protein
MLITVYCGMSNSKQISFVKKMIDAGEVQQLKDIFDIYPITLLIKHLRTNHKTLTTYLNDVTKFKVGMLARIAEHFQVDPRKITDMIWNQYEQDNKKKPVKRKK